MRVVFLGSGAIGLPSLEMLLGAADIVVAGVVTQPDRPAGRGMRVAAPPVKEAALRRGVAVLQPRRLRDEAALAEVAALRPDLLVVMAYGQILPASLLAVPSLGTINLHASLLPRHRGAAPVHSAILAGDDRSGVTVMWVDEGLDTGDILLARECAISPDETAGSLHDKLAGLAPGALADALARIRGGNAPRVPQDAALATYSPKLDRSAGEPDWTQAAEDVARRIRAMHPWPGSTVMLRTDDGRRMAVKIHRAAAAPGDGAPGTVVPGTLHIACGGGGMVELLEVQPAGGRRMGAGEFLRGHRIAGLA